ncbi:MAG: hypothetical protein HYV03_02945, partial [Deltaproteobacteria bacterium]|nr:hypothetical protein [Deltaproteobacteria bacterium]
MTGPKCLAAFLILIAGGIATPSSAVADGFGIHGSVAQRYKFRATGAAEDNDLETTLMLDLGDSQADRLSAAVMAAALIDLDRSTGNATFGSIYDTYSSRAVGRLYYAYGTANDLGPVKQLRFGRQHRYEFESLYFDGVHLESDPFAHFTLSAFGGVPVHLFENQFGFDPGDWLVGGAVQWDPLANLRARADYVYLRDKVTGFRASVGDQQDHLFGGSVWWDPDQRVGLFGRFTAFSDQVRDATGQIVLRFPEQTMQWRIQVYRLLKGYAVRVIDWDAFGIAGTYQPYTEILASVSKGLGRHLTMEGGGQARLLDSSQVASAFNHGFTRGYLSATTADFPIDGMSISATGDYYHGQENSLKNDMFGGSAFIAQELMNRRMTLSGGTMYFLYRYDLFSGQETNDVQTYFARIKGKFSK